MPIEPKVGHRSAIAFGQSCTFGSLPIDHQSQSKPLASAPLTIAPPPDSSFGRLVQTQLPTWTTTFEPNIASGEDFVTMMQIRCGSFKLPEGFR